MNGPDVRAIELVNPAGEAIRREQDNSNLTADPCGGNCEGMRSYCCGLDNHSITGLLDYPAEVLFNTLLAGLKEDENWM